MRSACALKNCARIRSAVTRNIATEACRQADNGNDFLDRIKREAGLEFETISCREEARLAITGCQCLLNEKAPYALVFDIGGGSTELIWSRYGQNGDIYEIADVLSLPFGVVNLAEHCRTDIIEQNCYETMVHDISKKLPSFCDNNRIKQRVQQGLVQMLGTSGTVTTLGAMHLNLPYYSRSRIDGLELNFEDISAASSTIDGTRLRRASRLVMYWPRTGRIGYSWLCYSRSDLSHLASRPTPGRRPGAARGYASGAHDG